MAHDDDMDFTADIYMLGLLVYDSKFFMPCLHALINSQRKITDTYLKKSGETVRSSSITIAYWAF